MRVRFLAALFFVSHPLAQPVWAAAKLVTPAPGQVNLGALVTVGGTITIPSPATVPREFDPTALPRLLPIEDPQLGLAVIAGDVAHLYDPATGKLVASLSGSGIGIVVPVPGQSDLLFIQGSTGQQALVRRERATGREVWRVPLGEGLTSRFWKVGTRGTSVLELEFGVPLQVLWLSSDERLTLVGLELSGKQKLLGNPRFGNRLLSIDWASGRVISDEHFAFYRDIGASHLMLLSVNRREPPVAEAEGSFKIVDSSTGATVASGQLAKGDLPLDFDEVAPRQFSWTQRWDFRPLRVGSELWLCARDVHPSLVNAALKFQDTWTRFDAQGQRIGRIEPPLRTAPECLLRDVAASPWPKVFAQVSSQVSCRAICVDGLLFLAEDGTFSSRPLLLPTGKTPTFKNYAWFHEGEVVYFLHDGGLYRSVPGERSATLAVPAPADDHYHSVPLVQGGNALLVGEKKAAVVSLRDGSVAPRSGEGAEAFAGLWSLGEGLIRLKAGLSETGLPQGFDRYEEGIAGNSLGTTEPHSARKAPQKIWVLRIWGEDEKGDMLLVPGLLKGGQAILVGIEWPINRVAFWLPIARLKGLPEGERPPGGSAFPYLVFNRDDSGAALAVLEDTNRITLYTIRRPGTAVQPQQP